MTTFTAPYLRSPDGRLLDKIQLTSLELDCVVGIYRVERVRRQPLVVDLALYLDTRPAARSADLTRTIDYAAINREIRFLLQECRFYLVETATEALCNYLLSPPQIPTSIPQVVAVALRLSKPQALRGGALPSIEVIRWANECHPQSQQESFGLSTTLHDSADCRIRRIDLAPGQEIRPRASLNSAAELTLTAGLEAGGKKITAGKPLKSDEGARAPRLVNPTEIWQSFLSVERRLATLEDVLDRSGPNEPVKWSTSQAKSRPEML